ncbi:DNA polymerase I [Candidatus Saccharibacteria bacterium]|nr:DNA polymerase I [Candidatus Saccharibacteria bacterium]
MKKLVIIDGKSVFYRGYYAMGNLSRKDGTPTSGVYGFAVIAMEIVRRIGPDKVVVAWDKAKTSIEKRKALYPEYKAGRVKPPEDFYAQIPLLRELVDDFSWGFLECDGYEADDIIGTLAAEATASDWMTYIVSSDLDMLQVVGPKIKMYRVLRGFSRIEEMDVAGVEAKYGIKKDQFLDLKALKGDASDNIPGVPGIGEKGAVSLLNKYGTLDGVYEHLDEITVGTRKKLEEGKKSAYLSKQLATIFTDAPVNLAEVPDFKVDEQKITGALTKLEFFSLVRRFKGEVVGSLEEADEPEGTLPDLPKDLIVSFDVKTLMHEQPEVAEKILNGQDFWDLGQGAFLLDPLLRTNVENISDERREYWRQKAEFEKNPKLFKVYKELDLPLIPVLYRMEQRGILIDKEYFAALKKKFAGQVAEMEQKIYELAGQEFNVNSPFQLSEILYDKLGLPTKGIKKKTRGYSTGAKELDKLKDLHPIVPALLEYREASKLLNTYIVPIPELADASGRVHTTFTQNVTATGRLSSVNPNLQNIPVRTEEGRGIRTGFVAEPGKCLISADYAQFELRLAAVLAGDEALVADFNSGIDIHTKTAADVFKVPMEQVTKQQRRAAKVINFGVLYGMSAKGLAEAAGMTMEQAKRFIEDYFAVRSPIRLYLDKILKQARDEGYVATYYGRRRPTPDVKSANFMIRTGAERAAQNMPIQGTEADLMKRAMLLVAERLPEGAEMILQIHDSLVVECDEDKCDEVAKLLQETMEGVAPELKIKLAVEVTRGQNWGEL